MTDSIETSEREALRLFNDSVQQLLAIPANPIAADRPLADEPATVQRLQQLANVVRLALVLLKDDHATEHDRYLVLAELRRCLGLPEPADVIAADRPLEPHPPHRQCGCADCAPSFEIEEPSLEAKLLGNVLARIHGDGGHYVLEHGLEKAAADAEDLVATWRNLGGDLGVAEFLPEAERGALEKLYQAMVRKMYAKHREGTSGFEHLSAVHLSSLLRRHVLKGDPVDVANFCAFLLFNGQRIEPLSHGSWRAQFLTEPEASDVAAQDSEAFDFLQRQPPKGWGVYRVPESDEILISKPNGDGVRIQPVRDALLYELASAMLPPEPSP